MPGEQRDDRADGEERAERDAHLARLRPVACEQHERRDEGDDHPEQDRDRHRAAEHRAEKERELHVAHSHPGRIRERREEESPGGAEGRDRPLRARPQRRLRDEDDRGGGHDDAVRDDPVLEVGRRYGDEREAEEGREQRLGVQPELPDAAGDEERRDELDGRIAERNVLAARPAPSTQHRVREERDVLPPRQLVPTRHAGRAGADDRPVERDARRDDVEERAERETGRECERCEGHVSSCRRGGSSSGRTATCPRARPSGRSACSERA